MDRPDQYAPTVAEVNLGHLRHNLRQVQERAGRAELMAVVKADAYGHGAVSVARALQAEGVPWFGVATVPEALALRKAGVGAPILVFAAPLPEWLPVYVREGLDVTVSSPDVAEAVIRTAAVEGPVRVHVKIDTGMGRIGLTPQEAPAVLQRLAQAPNLTLASLWTHFATSDEPGNPFIREQVKGFNAVPDPPVEGVHFANSGALAYFPDVHRQSDATLVRCGIALYGGLDDMHARPGLDQRPVMTVRSRVTHLKTILPGTTVSYGRTWTATRHTRIATVGAGYADGYPRSLSNRAHVGIRGRLYPVAGRVCMDMFMVDVGSPDGPGAEVRVGDSVVLFGEGGPSVTEVARWAESITYELFCRLSARVPRVYVDP